MYMKKNMGKADRTLRVIFAALVAALYFTNMLSGTWALVLGILAIVFIFTSLVGFCPLYVPLRIRTRKNNIL